jgi:hypothetical protein
VQELWCWQLPWLALPRWGRFLGLLIVSVLLMVREVELSFFDTAGVLFLLQHAAPDHAAAGMDQP